MYPIRLFFAAFLCVAIASAAYAGAGSPIELEQIRTQQKQIREEVLAGKGRYADMSSRKRDELLAKQDGLLQFIEGKSTESELTEKQKMEAFNSLEWIEAAINNADDERVICKSEKPTGSNRAQKVCKTVAQIRQEREDSSNAVDRRAICSEGQMCGGK